MTTCGGSIYLTNDENKVFSCSMEDLLKSTNSSDGGSVWTRLANIPTHRGPEDVCWLLEGKMVAIQQEPFTAMMRPLNHGVSYVRCQLQDIGH